jgi:fucose permease
MLAAPMAGLTQAQRALLGLIALLNLLGLGIDGSFPSLMTLAMSGATREDTGLASGLVNTAAQVGGAPDDGSFMNTSGCSRPLIGLLRTYQVD